MGACFGSCWLTIAKQWEFDRNVALILLGHSHEPGMHTWRGNEYKSIRGRVKQLLALLYGRQGTVICGKVN